MQIDGNRKVYGKFDFNVFAFNGECNTQYPNSIRTFLFSMVNVILNILTCSLLMVNVIHDILTCSPLMLNVILIILTCSPLMVNVILNILTCSPLMMNEILNILTCSPLMVDVILRMCYVLHRWILNPYETNAGYSTVHNEMGLWLLALVSGF